MADIAIAETAVVHEDERATASRIAAGERPAFEALMRRYNRRLYRLARATLRDRTEAEDALQDAYICAYRSMGQFRGDASLSTWLSRLVLNECFARMRRSARRQNVMSIAGLHTSIESQLMCANEDDSPEEQLERAQIRDILERKVDA